MKQSKMKKGISENKDRGKTGEIKKKKERTLTKTPYVWHA